jgi:DNA-binding transcriptional MerR regulator
MTAAALGLTYRQLDHWSRVGYLRPEGNGRGSGSRRRWPAVEQRVARLMGRLTAAGMQADVAAVHAREAIELGAATAYLHLGDGIWLTVVVDV